LLSAILTYIEISHYVYVCVIVWQDKHIRVGCVCIQLVFTRPGVCRSLQVPGRRTDGLGSYVQQGRRSAGRI